VSDATGSIAYLPDHSTTGSGDDPRRRDVADLVAGVDVLIHDAQFVDAERAVAEAYGHATISDAACIAQAGAVGTLALFHHGPDRTDAQLAELAAGAHPSGVTVMLATEATVLSLPRTPSC
jgi:ribonuclease BN (tRNA processing enzyme)